MGIVQSVLIGAGMGTWFYWLCIGMGAVLDKTARLRRCRRDAREAVLARRAGRPLDWEAEEALAYRLFAARDVARAWAALLGVVALLGWLSAVLLLDGAPGPGTVLLGYAVVGVPMMLAAFLWDRRGMQHLGRVYALRFEAPHVEK